MNATVQELVKLASRFRSEAQATGSFRSDAECVRLAAAEIERQTAAARIAKPAARLAQSPAPKPSAATRSAQAFDVSKPHGMPGLCVSGGTARFN